jgi:hypothetical protein
LATISSVVLGRHVLILLFRAGIFIVFVILDRLDGGEFFGLKLKARGMVGAERRQALACRHGFLAFAGG